MDKQTISIPLSYLYEGQWVAAEWCAQVVDDETGEIMLTAVVPSSPNRFIQGLRLTTADVARLRAALPAFAGANAARDAEDDARAVLAYWRESVEFAVSLLAKGRTAGQNIVTQSGHAEEYLRRLLALDGMPPAVEPEPCYDCRTNIERIAVLEDRLQILSGTMRRIVSEIDRRLDALEAAEAEAEAGASTNRSSEGWAMFEFAVRLTSYAEREKRLANGDERAYWQGTCDACRKLTAVFQGQGLFSDLFSELDRTVQDDTPTHS